MVIKDGHSCLAFSTMYMGELGRGRGAAMEHRKLTLWLIFLSRIRYRLQFTWNFCYIEKQTTNSYQGPALQSMQQTINRISGYFKPKYSQSQQVCFHSTFVCSCEIMCSLQGGGDIMHPNQHQQLRVHLGTEEDQLLSYLIMLNIYKVNHLSMMSKRKQHC